MAEIDFAKHEERHELGEFDDHARQCPVCRQWNVLSGELCSGCAKGNDPFFTAENCGKDLKP